MKLEEIVEGIEIAKISGNTDNEILALSHDSRKAKPGTLFVAIQGEKADGHEYMRDAIEGGACAVVYDKAEPRPEVVDQHPAVTFIRVRDSRAALASLSNNFYRKPSQQLKVVGITGTNGKTTTAYLLKAIFESWGKKTGLIGTIQYMIQEEVYESIHTTPEASEFQMLLNKMVLAGCEYVVAEVSSHALVQKRVDGTVFRTGVFTNLTSEHLDFHETIENYYEAKARFFSELLHDEATAVINYDDIWGRKLMELLRGSIISYGLETGSEILATEINSTFDGLTFTIVSDGKKHPVVSPLVGLPNVYNILSAVAAARSQGVPWESILSGIQKAGTIRGRFEKVAMGQGFLAVVDYAHTEDALERLIYTARGLAKGKIITVFGCGGDRDRGKRPAMGAIATKLSDSVIITSDNPRSEDPEKIMKEIESGARRRNYLLEADREEAIRRSVMMASEGDVVLIAGKGHETYQEIKGKRYTLNDKEVLEKALQQLINNG
jgi:UDP-N-acetylmuramoyl-L-alanyl-D-glutamate--2,6-diaminopimelate ligase